MRTYIRTDPFPRCKHCGVTMDYYVLGLPDSEHEHPGCAGAAAAERAIQKFRRLQRQIIDNEDE